MEAARTVEGFSAVENALSRFRSLDQQALGSKQAQQLASSDEGVKIVRLAVESAIATLKKELEKIAQSSETMKFNMDSNKGANELTVQCPFQVKLWTRYFQKYTNILTDAGLTCLFRHAKYGFIDKSSEKDVVRKYDFKPNFDHTMKLIWSETERSPTTEQLVAFVLNELAEEIAKHHAEAEAKNQLWS